VDRHINTRAYFIIPTGGGEISLVDELCCFHLPRFPAFLYDPNPSTVAVGTDYMFSPDCLLILLSMSVYCFLVFLFSTFQLFRAEVDRE